MKILYSGKYINLPHEKLTFVHVQYISFVPKFNSERQLYLPRLLYR